jgi:cyclic pyranopterin phosphate synthase
MSTAPSSPGDPLPPGDPLSPGETVPTGETLPTGDPLPTGETAPRLTHLDADGTARMVDVGAKASTERRAIARATVRMSPATAAAIVDNATPKAEALTVARIAGIQAAKRTGELIPLCHPLPLTYADVAATVDVPGGRVTFTAETRIAAQTGIEMEAMTAASVAALTLYDMIKGLERGVSIEQVVLLEKSGGASGTWRRPEDPCSAPR